MNINYYVKETRPPSMWHVVKRASIFTPLRRFSSKNNRGDEPVSYVNSKAKDYSIIKEDAIEEVESDRRRRNFAPFGAIFFVWLMYFCYWRDPKTVTKENEAFDERQQKIMEYLATSLDENEESK